VYGLDWYMCEFRNVLFDVDAVGIKSLRLKERIEYAKVWL
jgi:hypothetical protein